MLPTDGSEVLDVLIIGCGAIAGGYDEATPLSPNVMTHAKAYAQHPGFRLAACVEPDEERRAEFMSHWNVLRGYATLAEVEFIPDVVSLCAPTPLHEGFLARLPTLGPALVFAEKPITGDLESARHIVAEYERQGIPLCVNHLRRWAPGLIDLRNEIASGAWGQFRRGWGAYTKGLLNNGSHMMDTLDMLLGPVRPLACGSKVPDGRDDDPTWDVLVSVASGAPVQLMGLDASDFSVFELELIFSGGRVSLTESMFTIRRRPAAPSADFPGYQVLAEGEPRSSGLGQAMAAAVDNIYGHLTRGEVLASDGNTALAAQQVCAALAAMPKSVV